jgi:hypothetical protein
LFVVDIKQEKKADEKKEKSIWYLITKYNPKPDLSSLLLPINNPWLPYELLFIISEYAAIVNN